MAKTKTKKIRITLVRSTIGTKPNHRATVKALGLGKINSSVETEVNEAILGMVTSVAHLVIWEEIK
ncbi:MAG: 50S ribosomal protein L30 [Spirochaetales bacterium]